MSAPRPIVAGGIAALLGAGTLAALFPPFDRTGPVAPADEQAFAIAQDAFASQMEGADGDPELLRRAGLEKRSLPEAPGTILLSEPGNDCAGRGIYWLRDGGAPLALTAPHRGSDRHTGTLAALLFQHTAAGAAAWNSAPRNVSDSCPDALDLAREEHHPFSAFSLAFAERHPDGLVVQLHGFERTRRGDHAARDAAMIVSDGTDTPSDRLLDLADCLSLAFAPQSVLVYPIGTGELGALTNAQGRILRKQGFGGFAHLEIAAEMREAMVADEELLTRLGTCLVEASA